MRFAMLIFLCAILFCLNLFFGAIHIPAEDVLNILLAREDTDSPVAFIILGSRLPQAVTAMFAGASLAVSGLLLQTAFRNPLAGPTILGVSSGASLGVAIVMLMTGGTVIIGNAFLGGYAAIVGAALIGSLSIMGLLILLSSIIRNDLMLLIVGILIGYLTSSLVSLLSSLSNAEGIRSFVMWGMGTFGDVPMSRLPIFIIASVIGLAAAFFLAKPLNLLLLGENYARNLGVRIKAVRNMLLLSTGLLTAVTTAFCGPVGFVGIASPHISRMLFKSDNHQILIPATILIGSIMTLLCNWASTIPENTVIPINALTPLAGVPVILYVILRKRA